MFRKTKLSQAVCTAVATSSLTAGAFAQEAGPVVMEEVYVQGIRGSLERAMDIKRDASGVVDAISAEDIGKFPDTNLAESLQRITGVSIDRVNGEGSNVTVRGFGGGNNLVTLNGRHIPAANVATVGGDQLVDFAQPTGRSFDFSNLASEGVRGLEVYKTGRASIPSGGIGATINIKTLRPLDKPGTQGSIGVKAVHDTSVIDGDDYTPEVSGLFSWTDDNETFGVSLFASTQERHSAAMSATSNAWNIRTFDAFMDPDNGFVSGSTVVTNPPPDPSQLVSVPNDSRWHRAEGTRERVNAMLTVQFRPVDSLTLTVDGLMVANTLEEQRNDQTNWFNRPFDNVGFDSNPVVATTVFLHEDLGAGNVKDTGFEQQFRATEDTLESFGFNADWQATDTLNLALDVYSSKAESLPNTSIPGLDEEFGAVGIDNRFSSVLFAMGAPVVREHSLDWRRSGFPEQSLIRIDDSVADTRGSFGGTNANGTIDAGDLGSQRARTNSASQVSELDGAQVDFTWEHTLGAVDLGFDQRTLEMRQTQTATEQTMGDWGIGNPGDIPADLVEAFCQACLFDDFKPNARGASRVSFWGDARELWSALSPDYLALDPTTEADNSIRVTSIQDNLVEEEISALYVQASLEGELGGRAYRLLAGIRHETTDVTATSLIVPDDAIVWTADNDFSIDAGDPLGPETFTQTRAGEYDNTLPSLDFSIDVTEDLVARASASKTIARPQYGNLFFFDNAGGPPRPTALGGTAPATSGNPDLLPLESRNLDVSVEWYYNEASYFSVGAYDKKIDNFIGTGVEERNLFGLRDPSSGAPGTRSGEAAAQLDALGLPRSDVNLFTMTALIDNRPSVADAVAEFQANLPAGAEQPGQSFVDRILEDFDVVADSNDPLFNFAVQVPINTREANIHGLELAWQHFFGGSGFGFQANYTTVNGDVGADVGSDPSVDQFALLGLSDSANFSLVYEKYGLSARVAYNWRDKFLNATNRQSDRNPVFVADYRQWDMNISYDVTDNLVVTFEAINITGENIRNYGRDESNVFFMQELDPRYLLGARYTF